MKSIGGTYNTHSLHVKNCQFKTVFNGDTAYITQVKQQNQTGAITSAAHRHNVNVLRSSKSNYAVVRIITALRNRHSVQQR